MLKPDLVAPGSRLVSEDRIELSGSSMAAGVVRGVAALMVDRNQFYANDQIKATPMYSTGKLGAGD